MNEAAVLSAKSGPWEVVLAYLTQLRGIIFWQIHFGWAWVWVQEAAFQNKTST